MQQITNWGNALMASLAGAVAMLFAAVPMKGDAAGALGLVTNWFIRDGDRRHRRAGAGAGVRTARAQHGGR